MGGFSKWLLAVFGAIIIGFVIELLFGESRLNKFFRYISATVTLLIVVSPLSDFGGFKNYDFFSNGYEFSTDENYMDFMLNKRIELLENHCGTAIQNAGIMGAKVDITAKYNLNYDVEIELVEINLSNSVINGNNIHINKNEVAIDAVYNYLKIEKNRITVNGQTKIND